MYIEFNFPKPESLLMRYSGSKSWIKFFSSPELRAERGTVLVTGAWELKFPPSKKSYLGTVLAHSHEM